MHLRISPLKSFRLIAHGRAAALVCALSVALCVVSGCGVERLTTFEQAVEYLDSRDYPRAIEWFKRDIELHGETLSNTYNLGVCYQDLGKHDEALEWYERALKIRPRDARSMVNMAMIYLDQRRDLKALALLEKAAEVEFDRAYPLVALGIYYQRQGNLARAGDYYREGLKREQRSAYAWFHYGTWNEANALMGDAAQAFEKAAELDPSDGVAYESAARCYSRQKNWAAASRNYDYAIAISPDKAQLYIDASDVLIEQKRYERATQYLWTARTLKSHDDVEVQRRLIKLYALMLEAEGQRPSPK